MEIQEEIHHFAGWEGGGSKATKIVNKDFVNKLAFPSVVVTKVLARHILLTLSKMLQAVTYVIDSGIGGGDGFPFCVVGARRICSVCEAGLGSRSSGDPWGVLYECSTGFLRRETFHRTFQACRTPKFSRTLGRRG